MLLEPYIWGQKGERVVCPALLTQPLEAFSDEVSGHSLFWSGHSEQEPEVRCLGMSHSFSAVG